MEEQVTQQSSLVTKSAMMRSLILFSVATIILSIVISILFGSLTAAVVERFFPNLNIQNQPVKVTSEQSAVVSAVQKANPAVVSIIISKAVPNIPQFNPLDPFGFLNNGSSNNSGGTTQQEVGGGSGFIIRSDGLILTNKHVASDSTSSYTVILSNGKKYDGTIEAQDPTNDIAIIKINATGLPTVTLGSSTNLQLGQSVIAIGNALGQYENTVSKGVVSGLNRTVTASDQNGATNETLNGLIQTDAQINPGNSGGPLLDISGNVIGMNTAIAQNAQGIGFAIPINQASADIHSVESSGKIVKPELGVRYTPVDSTYLQQNASFPYTYGAVVAQGDANTPAVVSGSPADKAGIVSGDVILEVNGVKIDQDHSLQDLIQEHQVGDTITLKIYHQGNTKDVSVKLDKSF